MLIMLINGTSQSSHHPHFLCTPKPHPITRVSPDNPIKRLGKYMPLLPAPLRHPIGRPVPESAVTAAAGS
jgi:hypothetical protein